MAKIVPRHFVKLLGEHKILSREKFHISLLQAFERCLSKLTKFTLLTLEVKWACVVMPSTVIYLSSR